MWYNNYIMILYFDTETTSLIPGQICEIAYIMQSKDKTETKNFFFMVDSFDEKASEITGYTVEKIKTLSKGKTFSDYAKEIGEDFLKADLVISHNFNFDYHFMQTEFSRLNSLFRFKQEMCSMKFFTNILKLERKSGNGYKYPKLVELADYFEIDEEKINTAKEKLFVNGNTFHSATFDTTCLYLCINEYMNKNGDFKEEMSKYL